MIPAVCAGAGALALGRALQIADGFYSPPALAWLSVAFAFVIAGVMTSRVRLTDTTARHAERCLHAVLAGGITWQLWQLFTARPAMYLPPDVDLRLFRTGLGVEAALVACGVARIAAVRAYWFPALLAVHGVLSVWMVSASPDPAIDVVVVHRAAFDALANGQNPYTITFKNIYGPGSPFYNPAAVAGDRVNFGFPYPPLSLLLAAPGHLALGDYRYSMAAAVVGTAAFIGYSRRALTAPLAAAVLLTTPRGFFVLEQGWTEPLPLLAVAATVFALDRGSRRAWLPAGVMLGLKQYLALAVPLLLRHGRAEPRGMPWLAGRAIAVAAALSLPFVLWDMRAFIDTVFLLQTREPFRADSLSYLSWAARAGWGEGNFMWAAGGAAAALVLAFRATPNNAPGFALSIALASFSAFAFGSKAFCNYYFFVVGVLAAAVGCAAPPLDTRDAGHA